MTACLLLLGLAERSVAVLGPALGYFSSSPSLDFSG